MIEIILDKNDDLFTVVKKISEASGENVRVIIPKDSNLGNLLSLKLIKREAEKEGKKITFISKDSRTAKVIGKVQEQKDTKPDKVITEAFVAGRDIARELEGGEEKKVIAGKGGKFRFFKRFKLSFPVYPKVGSKAGLTFTFILLGLILLLVGLTAAYLNLPTATINLVVNPESLVKSLEVVATPSTEEVDKEKRIIPARPLEFFEKGNQTTKVTGTEIVGEKTEGEIAIYNKTDKEKKFGEGTKIVYGRTEGEDLVFLLNGGISVPPREASTSAEGVGQSTITYIFGKKEVGVTAEKIGDEYNLSKSETFVVDDHPTSNYIAQSENDFTGGSKREVKIVTADDQQYLQKELQEKLKNKIKERIQSSLAKKDDVFREEVLQLEILSQKFDKELGEETEEVTLEMEVKGAALIYSERDLNDLLADVLKQVVPERFSLAEDDQSISVEGVSFKDGKLEFFAKVKGYAIPKIDAEKLKDSIRGKKLEVVQAYLSSLTNIDSYEIDLFPALPRPFRTVPHKKENITVNVTYE